MSQNKKILVCDDDTTLVRVFKFLLTSDKIDVVAVNTGGELLPKVLAEKPNLILLDLKLPDKDGMELLKELKENEETKNITVIVASGVERKEDIDKAFGLGAIDYVIKPFVPVELKEKLLLYLK